MIVVTELALIAAAVGGSTHALGHDFVIFGSRLDGLAVGPPFVCGIAVRMVGLLALEHAAAARLEPARRGLRVAAGAGEIPTPDNGSRQLAGERTPRPRGGIARPGGHPARSRSNKANVMIMFGPRERPRRRACGRLHPVHRRREVGRRNRERIALNRPGIQQDTRSKKERS